MDEEEVKMTRLIAAVAGALALMVFGWFAVAVACGAALPVPTNFYPTVSSTGLGDEGQAVQGRPWDKRGSWPLHVILLTGDNPGPVVTVTVNTRPMGLGSTPSGDPAPRAICFAIPAWSMPEYSFGWAIPEWPLAFVDIASYNNTAGTVTFRLRMLDALHALEPYSNYSLNVLCPPRD